MISVIDLDNVIIDGVSQDLVSAIANNLKGDLVGILTALKVWDKSRRAEVSETSVADNQKQIESERQSWQQEKSELQAKIAQLKTKLSPAICEILPALLKAGLEEWAEAAITNANPEDGVFAMVLRLKEAAQKPPYIGQCQDIKDLFGPICYYSKTVPTYDQATRMQLVLNIGPSSTGPVAKEYLNFHPWIKSEEA